MSPDFLHIVFFFLTFLFLSWRKKRLFLHLLGGLLSAQSCNIFFLVLADLKTSHRGRKVARDGTEVSLFLTAQRGFKNKGGEDGEGGESRREERKDEWVSEGMAKFDRD